MLSEKNLGQKGKMSRNNKQKFQLNRVERPEGGAPFCDKRKAQQEEEGLLFPGKDSAKEKLRTLCFLQSSQLFFFLSLNTFSPCHVGACIWLMVANPKMQFSADSESELIFAREIPVSLFVSAKLHQHHT